MKFIIIIFILNMAFSVFGAEADNFTARTLNLVDQSAEINDLANRYLQDSLEQLNLEGDCSNPEAEQKLYEELRKYFSNHSNGELVKNILYTDFISKNVLPLKESVYGEWSIFNGYLLGRKKAATSPLALSPLIQIGDQIIGVDKLEHLFGMGFSYFTQYRFKHKTIERVLKNGIVKEKTFLGGNIFATGVFSYGDLSANFNGMRFWNHVLLKEDDILGREYNLGPYVTCQGRQWVLNQKIDFRNYADASMDESINCSKFATKDSVRKFKKALDGLGMSCPMDSNKLNGLKEKYKAHNIQHFIINEDGNETVSYFNEF